MKKCPNCGRDLHDDAIFCFGCMSELNERKEIPLISQRKITVRSKIVVPAAIAVCFVTGFGVYAYDSNADKAATVEKSPIQTQTVTVQTTVPVTTTAAPVTTSVTTTTTRPEPDKSAIASDMAAGASLAQSKAAEVTTTTTTTAEEEPQPQEEDVNIQQEVIQNGPAEPEYLSPDGASQMTLDLLDYVNPQREQCGLPPFHASGQFDQLLEKSTFLTDDNFTGIGDTHEHLSEVGLPSSCKIRQFTSKDSYLSDYDEAYAELLNWLKDHANFGLSYGDDLIHGLEDYTYLGVYFFHDEKAQERKDHMQNGPYNDEYESMPLYQCYVYVMK